MDWKQILTSADDDYLIGISNKGIVKRAYKDKEEITEKLQMEFGEESLTIVAGGEMVKLHYPLVESKCSCPSRSICRHVVLAILGAREQLEMQGHFTDIGGAHEEEQTQKQAIIGQQVQTQSMQQGESEQAVALQMAGVIVQGVIEQAATEKEVAQPSLVRGTEESIMQSVSTPWEEIKSYPLKPLMKVLGVKAWRSLAERMQRQECPAIESTSIVTVKLSEQEVVVKLLSPLAHSACTCHKKDLCKHKAEAILWCQWKEKLITADSLRSEAEQEAEFDKELIQEAAVQIKAYLEELLCMGLCRTSVEVVNTLERLAILAHNALLPRLESNLRALADTYGRYLRRSASFRVNEALRQLCGVYQQALGLLRAETNDEISRLAGEFRAEYKPVGDLELIGITMEHFVSQSGYEGNTVYFLERNTGLWYTYTSARPTFYEGKKKGSYTAKTSAPWGLSATIEDMVKMKIHLQNARSDDAGRLSSGQETKGELLSGRVLEQRWLKGWYYTDFGQAFVEQVRVDKDDDSVQRESLVFLEAARVEAARFDKVRQVLYMPIWDDRGRGIWLEVPYTKKEEATIRYLEKMKPGGSACFVGRLYLKGSSLRMHPLEVFTGRQLPWLRYTNAQVQAWEAVETGGQDAVLAILAEMIGVLGDLYQVGFSTVQEVVLQNLQETCEKAENYGMQYAARELLELGQGISKARHQLRGLEEQEQNSMFQRYMALWDYVAIGHKKVMYDKAKLYYKGEEEA